MDALVTLTGNVGTDVDYRSATEDRDAWATFRLGHTPGYFREGKWTPLTTVWVTVHCRRMLARNVNNCLRKGDSVLVTGKLRSRQWTDEKGDDRETLVLEADGLGPDLTWGTASFARAPRRDDPAIRTGASGEDPWGEGAGAGGTGPDTDARTGEVLTPVSPRESEGSETVDHETGEREEELATAG